MDENGHFRNCVKIKLTQNEEISRKDIISGLKDIINLQEIKRICQFKSKYLWYVVLIDSLDAKVYYNKEIIINEKRYYMIPPINEFIYQSYLINWLPPTFDKMDFIIEKLCVNKIGECVSIKERSDEHGIGLNVYTITIKYPRINKN
jgi:hypothetical protein